MNGRDIEVLKAELITVKTQLKEIKDDISEIKRKLDGFTKDIITVKMDVEYLKGERHAKSSRSNNNYWLKFSVAMLRDLVILALVGSVTLKTFGVV